jgi:hypothetical protein
MMRWRVPLRRAVWLLAISIALASCGPVTGSPEAQVRDVLRRARQAAEAKDLDTLADLIAEDYTDDQGNDRRALRRLLQLHFLRNASIHLLTHVRSLELPGPTRAEVAVFVAMAGRPIAGWSDVQRVRADLFRFDFGLREEGHGDWRLTRSAWRRARPSDLP